VPTVPTVPTQKGEYCGDVFVPYPQIDGITGSAIGFSAVGILIGLLGLVFIAIFWDRPIMKMGQRKFLVWFCFAVALMNAGALLLTVENSQPSSAMCMTAISLIELCCAFIVVLLGVKEYRAWKLRFSSLRFERVPSLERRMNLIITAAVLVLAAILVAWFIADTPKADPCDDYVCVEGPWFLGSMGYLVFLFAATTGMGFIARDVPSVGGESSSILYTTAFLTFAMVILVVAFSLDISSGLRSFLFSFALFWVSVLYLFLIVFRKYTWIEFSSDELTVEFLRQNTYPIRMNTTGMTEKTAEPVGYSPQYGPGTSAQNVIANQNRQSKKTEATLSTGSNQSSSLHSEPAQAMENRTTRPRSHQIGEAPFGATHRASPSAPLNRVEYSEEFLMTTDTEVTLASRYNSGSNRQSTRSSGAFDIQAMRANAFLIASSDGWEEYVDRTSGESFWIQTATGRVSTVPPSTLDRIERI